MSPLWQLFDDILQTTSYQDSVLHIFSWLKVQPVRKFYDNWPIIF